MTLLAAYQLLLSRYAGQDDVVVGSPIANRNRSEIENLIGFFVNMLVLRTQIGPDESFNSVLGQVRQHALDGFNHQDVPFEKLVDALNVRRDMSFPPVFQVAFIMQNAPRSELDLGEITMSVVPAEGNTAKYDLTLIVLETAAGYRLLWEYCTDLFAEETIVRLATHFTYLSGKCADPAAHPGLADMLSAAAEHQTAGGVERHRSGRYPQGQCTHQLFEAQAEKTPEAVALAFEDHPLTYAELNKRSNQLAHYLRSQGDGPRCAGGHLRRALATEMIVGMLGILKAGRRLPAARPGLPAGAAGFTCSNTPRHRCSSPTANWSNQLT